MTDVATTTGPMTWDRRPAVQAGGGRGHGVQQTVEALGEYPLRAPFPYYGGKARWAPTVWLYFGSPGVFVEPFLGTGAVTLAKPDGPARREVVCDRNGYICNFYRALVADHRAVARWADWPTLHQDLTARHRWLQVWGAEHADRLSEDPLWCDFQAAGWWVWGISNWIGHGWCDGRAHENGRPAIAQRGGRGVSAQREKRPLVRSANGRGSGCGVSAQRAWDVRPNIGTKSGGQGVSAQRSGLDAAEVWDQRPYAGKNCGGRGVNAQRDELEAAGEGADGQPLGGVFGGDRLIPWFGALARRLAKVVVLNRDWSSAVTPSVLQQTPSGPQPSVAVFLDPPYRTADRHEGLYMGDAPGVSDDVAIAAYEWAVEHGARYRIGYACRVGDFDVPAGWSVESRPFDGQRNAAKRARARECILFSPACVGQGRLW